jgi:hypothetical protein
MLRQEQQALKKRRPEHAEGKQQKQRIKQVA